MNSILTRPKDQPLLRLPFELSRTTFKTAHRHTEQTQAKVEDLLKTSGKNAAETLPDGSSKALASLDQAIAKLQALKSKLGAMQEAQELHSAQSTARIEHLDEVYHIPTLSGVKYDRWSRTRLDRLLVDYLVRNGYTQSARALAKDRGIEKLVDVDEFEGLKKIESSLRNEHRVDLALTWCGENKQTLRKMESTFEFELRLQQYVEMIRSRDVGKLLDATFHARKYLIGPSLTKPRLSIEWAGLLAFDQDTEAEPYNLLFAPHRWNQLADKFLETHHKIFSLPLQPQLHIALTAGLSALKTPACHSKNISPTSGLHTASSPQSHTFNFSDQDHDMIYDPGMSIDSSMDFGHASSPSTTMLDTPVCPICSNELNQLAKGVPFALHSKSIVESDPVVLPNGRVYGKDRLLALNQKMGARDGFVFDPLEPEKEIPWDTIRKIFIM